MGKKHFVGWIGKQNLFVTVALLVVVGGALVLLLKKEASLPTYSPVCQFAQFELATRREYSGRSIPITESNLNQLKVLLQVGDGRGYGGVAFSPDGAFVANGAEDGVRIWRVSDGEMVDVLGDAPARGLAFSPDGKLLATGDSNGKIRLWRMPDLQMLCAFQATSDRAVEFMAFSPEGDFLAASFRDGFGVWKISKTQVFKGPVVEKRPGEEFFGGIAFSPNGRVLAVGTFVGGVQIRRVSSGKLKHTLSVQLWKGLAFSHDGKFLVIGSVDGVQLWRASDGVYVRTIEKKGTPMEQGWALSPDWRLLATVGGGVEKVLKIWRMSDGALLKVVTDDSSGEWWGVAFSPDGSLIAISGGDDYDVRILGVGR